MGRANFLPFSRPTIEADEIDEVVDSLKTGWITSGPKVQRFEQMFVERLGTKHAVAVNSATAGLHIAMLTLNLAPDDEVIVPALTWPSTANVVEQAGGRTVFADVEPDTLNMDLEDVRKRITPRTRALVPVHFAGAPVDLSGYRALCAEHGLTLIQDAAHAVGTFCRGVEVGAQLGPNEMVVFSFHPIKNITTGEGGMVMVDDDEVADRLRLLRFHGVSKDAWKRYQRGGVPRYEVVEPGWKYNMLDLQAALGIHQLEKLERFNARRTELAKRYQTLLTDLPEVRPLGEVSYPGVHAWHLFIVRLDIDALTIDRDHFMAALGEANIGVGLHFPAVHRQLYYREKYGYEPGSLPHAEAAGERILSLPLYPLLTEADQDDVVAALREIVQSHRRTS